MGASTGDFSRGRVSTTILKLGLPMMLAEFVHVLYSIVDRMYIGHMAEGGTLALTGLGICFPLITLIGAFANLFSTGGATLMTIARGSGDNRKAERIMGTSFTMLMITGGMLTVLLFGFAPGLLRLLGGDAEKWIDYAGGGFAGNEEILTFLCEYEQDAEENWNLVSWREAESAEEVREWMTHVTCCEDRIFRVPVDPSRQVQVFSLKRLRENLRFMDEPDLDLNDPETLKNLPSFENVGCQTYRWILGE
jgi:hypothetical protein